MTHRPNLLVHLGWELILGLAVLTLVGLAAQQESLFENGNLLWSISYLGLLASGLAFSLRLGTPNLAVPGAATVSMVVYGELALVGDAPPVVAALVAVLAAGALGVALALAAELLDAPAWAVTLAGSVSPALFVAALATDPPEPVTPGGAGGAVPWLLAFLVISVGGGAWFATSAIRRRLAAADPDAEQAADQLPSWLRLMVGLTGSSLLGGLAGVVAILATGDQFPNPMFGTFPMFTASDLFVVLGAVLLGGVSIHGDRAGIAGTALGVILLAVILAWLSLAHVHATLIWLVLVLALVAGFGLRRAMTAVAPPTEDAQPLSEPELDRDEV